MKTLTATQARKDIYRLLDEASDTHKPIQETLYLTSIPGMQESIVEGMNTPLEETDEELDW
jgi:PHD/YefM family antitoxin component YafN of YafNO toxin-antitoxin module